MYYNNPSAGVAFYDVIAAYQALTPGVCHKVEAKVLCILMLKLRSYQVSVSRVGLPHNSLFKLKSYPEIPC